MKKVFILLLVLAMLLPTLSSCGFDTESAEAELVGTWGIEGTGIYDSGKYWYYVFLPNGQYRYACLWDTENGPVLMDYMTGTYYITRESIDLRQDDGKTKEISFRWNNRSGRIVSLGNGYTKVKATTGDFDFGRWTPNTNNDTSSNNSNTDTPQAPTTQKTAYELLSKDEKFVFDAFIVNFYRAFDTPSSVRITDVRSGISFYWDDHVFSYIPSRGVAQESEGTDVLLEISFLSSGEMVRKQYSLKLEDGMGKYNTAPNKKGAMAEVESNVFEEEKSLSYISAKKLNDALSEYCEKKGYK